MYNNTWARRMPNQQSVKRMQRAPKNFGFWDFCAVAAVSSAAVKLGKSIIKAKERKDSRKEKDLGDLLDKAEVDTGAPKNYKILADEKITTILKCRRKIMELMDLYGCCTEAEIFDVMGFKYEDDNIHRVFDATTKFTVKFEDGKFVLYSQAPKEVFEETCPDEVEVDEDDDSGDEDEA